MLPIQEWQQIAHERVEQQRGVERGGRPLVAAAGNPGRCECGGAFTDGRGGLWSRCTELDRAVCKQREEDRSDVLPRAALDFACEVVRQLLEIEGAWRGRVQGIEHGDDLRVRDLLQVSTRLGDSPGL